MKISPTIKFLITLIFTLLWSLPLHGQDLRYIQLKERYIGGEIESGFIMNQPAYSIGFAAGQVQKKHFQLGLSLHFLINNITRSGTAVTEEFNKLNLLGLQGQYYRPASKKWGFFGSLGLHMGTAELNKRTITDVTSLGGFTMAIKPQVGMYYTINKRSELYLGFKYMGGLIFEGTETFSGAPLVSLGVRFREIGF